MNYFITGGTGFTGTAITRRLLELNRNVSILARPGEPELFFGKVKYISGDPTTAGSWQDALTDQDVIINLAGSTIFRRWTGEARIIMRESRIKTTANLVEAIPSGQNRTTLISTSAVGYYGSRKDEILYEDSSRGTGFLADLASEWEETALEAENKGARVIIPRFGVVLGPGGGAMDKLIPLFKKWLGSPLGNGMQWFSWIHLDDLVNAIIFASDNKKMKGPMNTCSPNPVINREMTKILGRALGKPVFMPSVPRFALSAVMGEMGSLFLDSQRVIPKALLDAGFQFQYPLLEEAMRTIIHPQD